MKKEGRVDVKMVGVKVENTRAMKGLAERRLSVYRRLYREEIQ